MPKDRGGIGRTGHKRKLAAARRAAAAADLPKAGATLPPLGAAAGASTDAEQVDFAPRGILKSNAGKSRSRIKKVRFVSGLNEEGKGPMNGWKWGGRQDVPFGFEKFNLELNTHRAVLWDRRDLRAHAWGVRVAHHVAAGCVGDWTDKYTHDSDWALKNSHRKWCPRGHPDPLLQVGRWCYDGKLSSKCPDEAYARYEGRFWASYEW